MRDPPEPCLPLDLGVLPRMASGMATLLLLSRIVPFGNPGVARPAISSDWRSTAAAGPRWRVASLARAIVPAERSGKMSTARKGAPLTSFKPVSWFRVATTGIPCAHKNKPGVGSWESSPYRSTLLSSSMSSLFPASVSCFATKMEMCLPWARAHW